MTAIHRYLLILILATCGTGVSLTVQAAFPVASRTQLKVAIQRPDDEQSMRHNRIVLDRMFDQHKSREKHNTSFFLVLTGLAVLVPCIGLFSAKAKWHLNRS